MRVLVIHNFYQLPGGEDQVFADETALLEAYGHQVVRYTVHNDEVARLNPLALAKATVWNTRSFRKIRALVRQEQPDVVHFHNTLPLISPAAYYAVRREGIAVVQTLHNYRLLCPGVIFVRDGHVCEDCLGRRVAWPGVWHACYRGSRAATGAVTAMLATHRALGTWTGQVNVYIAPTEFVRQKYVQGGMPADKIKVKPHFVHPEPRRGLGEDGGALFVGRLSPEKGVLTLLSAWSRLSSKMPLKIVGDGPLAPRVVDAARALPEVAWLGRRAPEDVLQLMGEASVVIVPSESYETFGRTVGEAFGVGTPVLAADIGAIAELVEPGRTGLLFRRGDPDDLAAQVAWMQAHPAQLKRMREEARAEYEAKYTAARNHDMLINIYETARERARSEVAHPVG